MSSRNMSLLPRATLHSDSEQSLLLMARIVMNLRHRELVELGRYWGPLQKTGMLRVGLK
jgi:hypothetical protein